MINRKNVITIGELERVSEENSGNPDAAAALTTAYAEIRSLMIRLGLGDPREKRNTIAAMDRFCETYLVYFSKEGRLDHFCKLPTGEDKERVLRIFPMCLVPCESYRSRVEFLQYGISPISSTETARIYYKDGTYQDIDVTGGTGLDMIRDLTAALAETLGSEKEM